MEKISDSDVKEILALRREDITMDLLKKYFAIIGNNPGPRFKPYAKFTLPAKRLYNPTAVETTVGRYIFNLYTLPIEYLEKYGYQNITLNKKTFGNLEEQLGNMVLNDELTCKGYTDYLDRGEWISLGTSYFLAPTMNYDINVPIPEVIKKRDELFNKYSKEIKKGDLNVANEIETEVLSLAKKKIKEKGNDAYDFFEGGGFDFNNNYKKSSIMAGATENPFTHKLDILKSNYIDGLSKEDIPILANLTVVGGYSRGVETQKGGYETKKINNTMQTIILDEPGTDCKTTFYNEFVLTNEQKSMFLDRYVLDTNGQLEILTEKNLGKYIGKKVKMRSPLFCKGEKICNKCAGELFYKMGIKNAGLLTATFSGSLMNKAMKKFHDASVHFTEINIENFIVEK